MNFEDQTDDHLQLGTEVALLDLASAEFRIGEILQHGSWRDAQNQQQFYTLIKWEAGHVEWVPRAWVARGIKICSPKRSEQCR